MTPCLTRRKFLKASAALAGWQLLPSGVWANPPGSKLRTAHIGIGGMGLGDLRAISGNPSVEVAALADVSRSAFESEAVKKLTGAKHFADYREMLASLGDKIDAVVVSTPDHTHFPAAKLALELGKPVYCQKPLTHRVAEAVELRDLAKSKNLVTQMGIQVHASQGYRTAVNFLHQGIIGKVSRVHVWTNKHEGYDGPPYTGEDPVPATLDWNLWLGTGPWRPYLKGKYAPHQWRAINDFGCGSMGDMGPHLLDTPCSALGLGQPTTIKATCRAPNDFSHPTRAIIEFTFPGTERTAPTLPLTWYCGKDAPSVTPVDNPDFALENGRKLPEQGAIFVGEDGNRLLLTHEAGPQLLPRSLLGKITKPELPKTNHYNEWIDAAMGRGNCSADFDYGAVLTIVCLLGVVATSFPGRRLAWDAGSMRFTDNVEADSLLAATYRKDF